MPATPEAIARFTSDGVLLTEKNQATKDADPNAEDGGDREIPMFFDDADHGEAMLKELFRVTGMVGRVHEAAVFADTLGLGSIIPIVPRAPSAVLVDEARSLSALCALRAFSFDGDSDSYACEFVGLPRQAPAICATMDSTKITMDGSAPTMDQDCGDDPVVPEPPVNPVERATMDSTIVTMDDTSHTMDEA